MKLWLMLYATLMIIAGFGELYATITVFGWYASTLAFSVCTLAGLGLWLSIRRASCSSGV